MKDLFNERTKPLKAQEQSHPHIGHRDQHSRWMSTLHGMKKAS